MHRLQREVDGKRVALVGNSEAILREANGSAIDGHELVIRINLGVPHRLRRPAAIGERTDIWATARYWERALPLDTRLAVWMKLTTLGAMELERFVNSNPHCPVILWPREFENQCREFVGADPSTGVRLLWWLRTQANPASVSLFGFDFWESKSHWSQRRNTPNHMPQLERLAFQKLSG